jgi:hypothetical protein
MAKKKKTRGKRITSDQTQHEPLKGLFLILGFLSAKSLSQMRVLNQEWRFHSEDDALWLALVIRRWPGTNSLLEAGLFANSSAISWYMRRQRVEIIASNDICPPVISNVHEELSKYRLLVELGTASVGTIFFSGLFRFSIEREVLSNL